jgi:hypothetical protein
MFRRISWVLSAVLLAFLAIPRPTQAFVVAPSLLEMSLDKTTSKAGLIKVGNDENQTQEYFISIQKFVSKGEGGQQEFLPPSETDGLPNWITFDRPSVVLKPGEERNVPFRVTVPANAAPGGYYAVIFFSNIPPNADANDHLQARARTGVLLFVTVNGKAVERLSLKETSLVGGPLLTRLPAKFVARIENSGTLHEIPMGEVTVRNIFGQTVAKLPLNATQSRILPNSVRAFSAVWQRQSPEEGEGFWRELREEWRNFAFGRYTATFAFVTRSEAPLPSTVLVFSVWPWHVLVLVALMLLGGGVLWAVVRSVRKAR